MGGEGVERKGVIKEDRETMEMGKRAERNRKNDVIKSVNGLGILNSMQNAIIKFMTHTFQGHS